MKYVKLVISIVLGVILVGLAYLYLSPDYNLFFVRSESMKPAVNIGDMIVTGPVDGLITDQLRPGMIITYEHGKEIITHRVQSIEGEHIITKGDATEEYDPWLVNIDEVRGISLFKIPYAGYLNGFIRTKLGWFIVIIIPAAVLVAFIIKEIYKEAMSTS